MSTLDDLPTTPHQPALPAEGTWYETEMQFKEEEPPKLFPENQNSNFGWIIRHVLAKFSQEIANWQTTLYNERFVSTSTLFLDQWEIEVGLIPNPPGATIEQRRQNVLSRLQRGPFTRPRRDAAIAGSIVAAFGDPILLFPAGVALVAAGVPFYAGTAGDVTTFFSVTEYPSEFRYVVTISNDVDPDIAAITQALERITPAGISFTIVRGTPYMSYLERMSTYTTYGDATGTGKSYEELASGE